MNIKYGNGPAEYGPGVEINLTGDEVATAIMAYLAAHNIHVDGPRTVYVNCELCKEGQVYVDAAGNVYANGVTYSGRGENNA